MPLSIRSYWIGLCPNPGDGIYIKERRDFVQRHRHIQGRSHDSRGRDRSREEAAGSQYANSCQQAQEAKTSGLLQLCQTSAPERDRIKPCCCEPPDVRSFVMTTVETSETCKWHPPPPRMSGLVLSPSWGNFQMENMHFQAVLQRKRWERRRDKGVTAMQDKQESRAKGQPGR